MLCFILHGLAIFLCVHFRYFCMYTMCIPSLTDSFDDRRVPIPLLSSNCAAP